MSEDDQPKAYDTLGIEEYDEPLQTMQFSITKNKRIRCRMCKNNQTFKNGCTFGKHYIFFHVNLGEKK